MMCGWDGGFVGYLLTCTYDDYLTGIVLFYTNGLCIFKLNAIVRHSYIHSSAFLLFLYYSIIPENVGVTLNMTLTPLPWIIYGVMSILFDTGAVSSSAQNGSCHGFPRSGK